MVAMVQYYLLSLHQQASHRISTHLTVNGRIGSSQGLSDCQLVSTSSACAANGMAHGIAGMVRLIARGTEQTVHHRSYSLDPVFEPVRIIFTLNMPSNSRIMIITI